MIIYTSHARQRMRERGITEADVEAVFLAPSRTEAGAEPGTFLATGQASGRALIVAYRQPERAKRVVVTAYWKQEK